MQNSDQSNPIAEGNQSVENPVMSEADLIASFMTESQGEAQDTEETESEETEETIEETELEESEETETEETEETEEESGETTSILDQLSALSAEDWDKLAKDRKSGLAGRIAELTRRAKSAEEREKLLIEQAKEQKDPLERPTKVEDERVLAITTIEDLAKFKGQTEEVMEWAQGLLDESGAAQSDDVIGYGGGGKEYTKREILAIRNNTKKLLKTEIQARLKEIQEGEAFEKAYKDVEERMPTMFPALKDEKSAASEARKQLLETPVLEQAMQKFPALKAWASAVTAFASHSIVLAKATGNKEVKDTPAKKKAPPSAPSGVKAANTKPQAGRDAKIAELERKYAESGSSEDLVRLETARMGG